MAVESAIEEVIVKPKSRAMVIGCRIFILLLTIGILATIGGVVGYYIGVESKGTIDHPATEPNLPEDFYYVGVSRVDVTGPIVQVNMMGYAHPEQIATGLHTRLYSRAFVIADETMNTRVAFVSFDSGMTSQLIKLEVVKRLKEKHGDLFTEKNVVISGTHTHSGPAGFFQFLLFEMTSLGHVQQSTDAFVDGILESIEIANSNLQKCRIKIGSADVNVGNINRSPTSYLLNPQEERDKYNADTEQELSLLRFETLSGDPIGKLSWYPVHPTNMNFTNTLINSDNKGRASTLFEKYMRKHGETLLGSESFVAAFAQSNQGDVSPRTNGPICIDTGLECEPLSSTCNGTSQNCVGFGPGKDMFDSTDILARRQLDAAQQAFTSATEVLKGPVSWSHQYVDISEATVTLDDGTDVSTCKPGMGYSFAAGCTDGAGAFNFIQGMTKGNPFWNTVRDFLVQFICTVEPPRAYYQCHQPKPVLLPTGYMDKPYAWHPTIVDVQLLRIGQLIIAAVPGEFSTMAGRRFREGLLKEALAKGMPTNTKVVIAGLSNVYTHYITTPEEYEAQRYEAASTIYGINTFHVYQQKFKGLIGPLVEGMLGNIDSGPQPNISPANQSTLAPLPAPDMVPSGVSFGDVIDDANLTYFKGDVVTVKFYGANPRHNMKLGSTYLEVQQLVGQDWVTVYTDTDWSTKFSWGEVNSTATSADINLFSTMFDVIAETTGVRFDLEQAMKLHEEGRLLDNLDGITDDDVITKGNRDRFLEKMMDKAVIYSEPGRDVTKAVSVESHVTIEWEIPIDQDTGSYRIVYHGDHMSSDEAITPFMGKSIDFLVQ